MKTFVRGEDYTSSPLHALSSRILSFFCFIILLQKSLNNKQHSDTSKHILYDEHGFA